MILVDSAVWIDYFNGDKTPHTDFLDDCLGAEPVAIGDLMLAEVLQGFRSDRDFRTARRLLLALPICELVNTNIAAKTAEHFRHLSAAGVTIRKTTDAFIATFCIESRLPLLYSDRNFDPFAKHLGLKPALAV